MVRAFTRSDEGHISIVLNEKQYMVPSNFHGYHEVVEGIKSNLSDDELEQLIITTKAIEVWLEKQPEDVEGTKVVIEDSFVFFVDADGSKEELHGTVVDRLLAFAAEGLPVEPLKNFIKKSMQNPSYTAIQELYDFLDHKLLPITEDGDFLAYKAVTHDYKDKRTGKFDNSVGQTVREERRKVDDNRSHGCSKGLHAGTLSYVNSFGRFNDGEHSDKCIIVKINPKDVVSVPLDCSCQKLRTCEYYVQSDYKGEMNFQLANEEGEAYEVDVVVDFCDDDLDSPFIDIDDVMENDEIVFDYEKGGEVSTRHLLVKEIGNAYVEGELLFPENCEGEWRRFLVSGVSNVSYYDE